MYTAVAVRHGCGTLLAQACQRWRAWCWWRLKAKLRADRAHVAYWGGRPRQARDLAESGLQYLVGGPNAAQPLLKHGRAAARLGDSDIARRAIGMARDARELQAGDDLLRLGGEFRFSRASQYYIISSRQSMGSLLLRTRRRGEVEQDPACSALSMHRIPRQGESLTWDDGSVRV